MITVFETIENVISVFSENYYCYLNLVFYLFFLMFFITKKIGNQTSFFVFFLSPCFLRTENNFLWVCLVSIIENCFMFYKTKKI